MNTDQATELINARIRNRNNENTPQALLSFYPKPTRFQKSMQVKVCAVGSTTNVDDLSPGHDPSCETLSFFCVGNFIRVLSSPVSQNVSVL
jgi:hypothetical protein